MAMRFSYACHQCRFATASLEEAQKHADGTEHAVDVTGTITQRENCPEAIKKIKAAADVRKRAIEAEIVRRGRALGVNRG